MLRSLTLAAVVLAAFSAAPAVPAAEADVALIQKFAGTWRGQGKLTGAEEGNLDCRLTMKVNGVKLFYNGRCAFDGQGSQTFQGAIGYNDELKRFEAKSARSPVVVGKRSGGGVVFNFSETSERGSIDSSIALTGTTIKFGFQIVDGETKQVTSASIPFKKS